MSAPVRVLCAVAWLVGCGGEPPAELDGGPPVSPRLVILDPPGVMVGVPFGGLARLAVRYEDGDGSPIGHALVSFVFLNSPLDMTGGASLSVSESRTDSDGVATVDLAVGTERVNFRVSVSAPGAAPAVFYVAVTDKGFTTLWARPLHVGARPLDSFDNVVVQLYRRGNVGPCSGLDVDNPPEMSVVAPSLQLPAFHGHATFDDVAAREPYTLLAWAAAPSGSRLAAGCVDLAAEQIRSSERVVVDVAITDRPITMPTAPVALTTTFSLAPIAGVLTAHGTDAPWKTLACPAGAGQLLVDCTLDAMVGDDPIDCVPPTGELPNLVARLVERRGAPGPTGCRPLTDALGRGSIDAQVNAAALAGGWPTNTTMAVVAALRLDLLASFDLASELTGEGPTTAHHSLVRATAHTDAGDYSIDLAATVRPVLYQSGVPIVVNAYGDLAIGAHGFTLRLGSLLAEAFAAVALSPAGLADRADTLGSALADSILSSGGLGGCEAMSALLCSEVEGGAGCVTEACEAAALSLDELLDRWWRELDGAGLDLALEGTALLVDRGGTPEAEAIGLSQDGDLIGVWSAQLVFSDGSAVALTGAFGGEAEGAE